MMIKTVLSIVLIVASLHDTEGLLTDSEDTELYSFRNEDPIILDRQKRTTDLADDNIGSASDSVNSSSTADEGTEEGEEVPLPEPEKFLGLFRKKETPQDYLREKMIGMIFTGEPEPLGTRPRPQFTRRRYTTRPEYEAVRENNYRAYDSPTEILKPLPFVPKPNNLHFGVPILEPSASRNPPEFSRPPPRSHISFRPNFGQPPRSERRPNPRKPKPRRPLQRENFPSTKDIFSNTVGPDFGPVTFEEFGANFEQDSNIVHSSNPSKRPRKPFSDFPRKPHFKPSEVSNEEPFGFPRTKFGGFSNAPKFQDFAHSRNSGGCQRYTEDICLDADNYPHEEILTSLAQDPARVRTLMAEVREQSADELVDGLTADQEKKYDYSHYYGNRRQDSESPQHRDFASDGGYLCPSEVKYARPKRGRNSKASWKFIVNMEKYSQTIRMEKCMKPGGSCSYVSHHYRATCNQVYNYQRLLSWEKKRGLHMDIFKVPSCCTCHIQGYAYVFPPLNKEGHKFSGSERVDQVVPLQPSEQLNERAPPYSPVNFPNLPSDVEVKPRSRTINSHQGNSHRRRLPSRGGAGGGKQRPRSTRRRVNYDYHPIIDFFENT